MKEIKIICDSCDRDITYTGNSIDYRLALKNERIQSKEGAVTDMMVYPILDDDLYFCGKGCLKKYISL